MQRSAIITPWIGSGTESDPFRPLLADAYPLSCSDVTGQPSSEIAPDPNAYTVEVQAEASMLDEIAADTRFLILWREDIEELSI